MFKLKTFEQLTISMIAWVRARTNKITDFSIGSKNRTLLEAVASVMEELYQQVWQALKNLIEETLYLVFDFPLLPADYATGTVTFQRNTAAGQDYLVPVGTIVAVEKTNYSDEIRIITTETVTLLSGTTAIDAPARAESVGKKGNVEAGKITKFITKPAGIDSVANSAAFIGGRDTETSVERKQRFRNYIASRARGTLQALEYAAMEISGVTNAKAMESPYVYGLVWDGASYLDITINVNDPYETPVNILPATEDVNDALYVGALSKFKFLYIYLSTPGVGIAGTWEYYNGSAWQAIPGITDGSSGLTQKGSVRFVAPDDWQDSKISNTWAFWIRFRVTTASFTTIPQGFMFVSPPPGVVELYVQSDAVEASSELLDEVAANVAAYRGGGISINVLSCTRKLLGMVVSIKVNTADYDKVAIQSEALTMILNYLNSFALGDNFFANQLTTKVMSIKNGKAILSCTIDIGDILVSAGEIIRPDTENITVTVVN